MSNNLSEHEEVWVRRDLTNRGKPYFIRESITAFWVYFLAAQLVVPLFGSLVKPLISGGHVSWSAWFQSIPLSLGSNAVIIVIPLFILTSPAWIYCIKRSRYCPVWLYAEQLNPERLTVFRLVRSPKILELNSSTLHVDNHIGLYKTIHINDSHTATKAKISLLTPEEYDRFMQYWNAANPQDTEAS